MKRLAILPLVVCALSSSGFAQQFRRGDCNADGGMNISDVTFSLNYMFAGVSSLTCRDACDANDDGALDITDPVFSANFLFAGGPPPAVPGFDCGVDPSADFLSCEAYLPCQQTVEAPIAGEEDDGDDVAERLHAETSPGCRILPVDADIGADVPGEYFGPAPATVDPSLVGPLQLLTAGEVDVAAETITLPLYRGELAGGDRRNVWYILTDTTDPGNAEALGLNFAPKLNFAFTGNAVRRGTLQRTIVEETGEDDVMVVFDRGTVDFSPAHDVQADVSDPERAFPPQVATPGSVGDPEYSPLVELHGYVYNAPMIAFDVDAADIHCPDGECNYDLVHDTVVAINAPSNNPNEGFVTLRLTPGFSFGRPVVYLSTDVSDVAVAALEEATFAPALQDVLVGNDDGAFSAVERIFVVTNGPLGCDNPQRQGLNSALVDGRQPFNLLGGIPTIATDYSPLWDVNVAEWTQEAIDQGIRNRLRDEFDFLLHVFAEFLTGPGGSEFGSSGVIVNCPIVARLL